MENGSTSRSESSDAAGGNGPSSNGAGQNGHLPLSARLLGVGVRGARSVGKATGIDRAVEVAAEEALVTAIESEAVERAMARVIKGPVVEEAVQGAIESDAVKRALLEAMDSELVDEVWRRLLASDQAQQLVERIAEAPEVRAAISAQGVGLLEDIGRTIGKTVRSLDDSFERILRRIFFRKQRPLPTTHAGFVSRALAYAIDGVFVNLGFTALVALVTLVDNAFGGSANGGSSFAIAVGSTAWVCMGSLYLTGFWALAGQTPGMRFVGIRLGAGRLALRRCLKRLLGLYLSVVTLGIGFLGVVFRQDRRGWEDRFSATDVLYDERRPEPAPWSRPAPPAGVPLPPEPQPAQPPTAAAVKPEPQAGSATSAGLPG
ncbi:MAG TPA: RDD family protein [Solirubrobacterales bacterium]|nr:RDD family protein [Solirubrobacterales bacterium]